MSNRSWERVQVGQLLERIEAGVSPSALDHPASEHEFGVLKVSAVTSGEFKASENKALPPDFPVANLPTVQAGDLLMSRANTVELVGAVALCRTSHPNLLLSDKILRLVPNGRVTPNFLARALRSTEVRRQIMARATGTSGSMCNISQATIREISIYLPPLPEQRRIAALLDQADGILRKRREAIVLAESFLRSAFLEMFGDPVGNPRGWEVKALGTCVVLNPTAPKELRTNSDEQVSFVSMASASERPRQPKYAIGLAADYLKGYTYFAKGDVLMAKITPCMENGKGAFLYDLPTPHGFGSTEFHVLRPNDQVLGEYLYHLLHSSEFRSAAASNMTGTAGQRRVPTAYLDRFALPLPPRGLQQRFADLVRAQSAMVGRLELAAEEAERVFQGLVCEFFGKIDRSRCD